MPIDKNYLSDVKMIIKALDENHSEFEPFTTCNGFMDAMSDTFRILNAILESKEDEIQKIDDLYINYINDYYLFNYCHFKYSDEDNNNCNAFRGKTCIIKKDFSSLYFIEETFFKENTNLFLNSLAINKYYYKDNNEPAYKSIKYDGDSITPELFLYGKFGKLNQQDQEGIINKIDEILNESTSIKL